MAGHDGKGNLMADIWNKYANTAARKHGKPGREVRPKSVTIDTHTHVAVPAAAEFIKPHLDVSTIPLAHAIGRAQPPGSIEQGVRARRVVPGRCLTSERIVWRHGAGGGGSVAGERGAHNAHAVERQIYGVADA